MEKLPNEVFIRSIHLILYEILKNYMPHRIIPNSEDFSVCTGIETSTYTLYITYIKYTNKQAYTANRLDTAGLLKCA